MHKDQLAKAGSFGTLLRSTRNEKSSTALNQCENGSSCPYKDANAVSQPNIADSTKKGNQREWQKKATLVYDRCRSVESQVTSLAQEVNQTSIRSKKWESSSS